MAAGKGKGKYSVSFWLPWLLVIVIFFILAIAMWITSFVTDHWIETVIGTGAGSNIPDLNDPLFYSRYQGLFKTCYTGGNVAVLPSRTEGRNSDIYSLTASNDQCVKEEAYPVFNTEVGKYGDEYVVRAHLVRTTVGLLSAGLFFLLIPTIIIFCAMGVPSKGKIIATSILSWIAAILLCGGMGTFTGIYFYQYNTMPANYVEFYNGWSKNTVYNYQNVVGRTRIHLGWSYILGWIAAGLTLIGAFLCDVLLCCVQPPEKDEQEPKPKKSKSEKQQLQQVYSVQQNAPQQQMVQQQQMVPQQQMAPVMQPQPMQPAVQPIVQPVAMAPMMMTPMSTMQRPGENMYAPAAYNSIGTNNRPISNTNTGPTYAPALPFYEDVDPNPVGTAGLGGAKIYNDAGSTFTPREYVDAAKVMDFH